MVGIEKNRCFLVCAGLLAFLSLTACGSSGGGDAATALVGGGGNSISASPAGGNELTVINDGVTDTVSGGGSGAIDPAVDTGSSADTGSSGQDPVVDAVVAATVVSWEPPFFREDGSFLSLVDVQGYRVYYGSAPGDYQERIDIDGGLTAEVDLAGLPSGVYYLVVTSIDAQGRESLYSEEFSITL